MLNQVPLFAVPGFLGRPSDWDFFSCYPVQAIDPMQNMQWETLEEWGELLNHLARRSQERPILMGYSLGGRVALHALLAAPHLWQGAVIISAHPGLQSQNEREQRLVEDERWAKRFEEESWESLMQAWDQQSVFQGDEKIWKRQEIDYQRSHLAKILRQASLGHQQDLRHRLSELQLPILWITGEKDARYSALAEPLTFDHPQSRKCQIEGAGHRVPWSHSNDFQKAVRSLLDLFRI